VFEHCSPVGHWAFVVHAAPTDTPESSDVEGGGFPASGTAVPVAAEVHAAATSPGTTNAAANPARRNALNLIFVSLRLRPA
jgi:hypothetical protein